MKALYITLIIFSFGFTYGQQTTPAFYREVFDFATGDSLQYSFRIDVDDNWHSYAEGYAWYVITGKTTNAQMVSYTYTSNIVYTHITNPLNYPHYGGAPPFSYMINEEDSFILYQFTDSDIVCNNHYDSVYTNTLYAGRLQNDVSRMCFETSWRENYAAGLGQTSYFRYSYMSGFAAGSRRDLNYYHKTNGESWGNPNSDPGIELNSGGKLAGDSGPVLYPNPARGFTTVNTTVSPQSGSSLVICDAQGRIVLTETISRRNTIISTAHIAPGLYYWRYLTRDAFIATGILVII
jgi:hypothetical protein